MKFARQFSKTRRPVTARRLAHAARAVARDKASVALFPELAHHQTAADRIAAIDADTEAHFQRMRDHTAQTWRRARRTLRQLPPELRARIMARWNHGHLPANAHYLADLIHTTLRDL
jgi:dephospho-CoA kinase